MASPSTHATTSSAEMSSDPTSINDDEGYENQSEYEVVMPIPTIFSAGNGEPDTLISDLLDGSGISAPSLVQIMARVSEQCLRFTLKNQKPSEKGRLNRNNLVKLAVCLAKPLERTRHKESFTFLELQLRAFCSVLALLHFKGVYSLVSDDYNSIEGSLPMLYSTIVRLPSHSRNAGEGSDTIRQSSNIYLVQLARQYFSIFRKENDPSRESWEPVQKIVYGTLSIAGGQYGSIRQVVDGTWELANVWRRHNPQQHGICSLQEHVRRIHQILVWKEGLEDYPGEAASDILSKTLEQVSILFKTDFRQIPTALNNRHKQRAGLKQLPPLIQKDTYFLGLLDILAQLCVFIDIRYLSPYLNSRLESVVFDTKVEEYRSFALRALLSCASTRQMTYERLRHILTNLPDDREDWTHIGSDIELIRKLLDDDEDSGIRHHNYLTISTRADLTGTPVSSPPRMDSISTIQTNMSSPAGIATIATGPGAWREQRIYPSITNQSVCSRFTIDRSIGEKAPNVGISTCCDFVFFYSKSRVRVMRTDHRPNITHLNKDYANGLIKKVTIGRCFMVIDVAHKGSHTVSAYHCEDGFEVFADEFRGRDAKDVAILEADNVTYIVVAHVGGRNERGFLGELLVYRLVDRETPSPKVITVPRDEFIKSLSLDSQATYITAVTNRNHLIAWRLEDVDSEDIPAFEYRGRTYTDNGVTSVSTFQPTNSANTYAFTTTFPTNERSRASHREWSYLTPLTEPQTQPKATLIRNFEHFPDSNGLLGGCVSNSANVFVILSNRNRGREVEVYYQQLKAHTEGGIIGGAEGLRKLPFVLHGMDKRSSACAVRFNPEGTHLYAVDYKGHCYVTEFRRA
ncbi:uncharacterized protein KY384_008625 [Bacidia gigantensis]|uniref:uncharacterized protein n=1 Tax=Bacidia gigantensis TaxID=2732470 RepID=UPI001D056A06|nr:uncharacterized protein KY384_008625 [Bacidia gigantensis]KAG8527195.1 hypothetical protein KY384_008625 [Bacidia gigantensis]